MERRWSGVDERRVAIHLTVAGQQLSSRATALPRRLAEAAGLAPEELEQLHHTLGRLTAALHNAAEHQPDNSPPTEWKHGKLDVLLPFPQDGDGTLTGW